MNISNFYCPGLGRGSKKRTTSEIISRPKSLRRPANNVVENGKSSSLPEGLDESSSESNSAAMYWDAEARAAGIVYSDSWKSDCGSEISTKAVFSGGSKSIKDLDDAVDFNVEVDCLAKDDPETCVKLLRKETSRLEIILENLKIRKLQLEINKMQRQITKLEEEEVEEDVRQTD